VEIVDEGKLFLNDSSFVSAESRVTIGISRKQ